MNPTDEIRDHQARCQPYLLRLRMVARGEGGIPLPQVVAEVTEAVSAILAEAEAAGREVSAVPSGNRGTSDAGMFLRVRLNRLAAAADEAVAAARTGNCGEMRRQLHRFGDLTSAIWTVQWAVYGRSGT